MRQLERERNELRADLEIHRELFDAKTEQFKNLIAKLDAERALADRLALALKMTRWDSPVTCKAALTAWKEARK